MINFTPRQLQVLDALIEHGNNKAIAAVIGVGEKAVEHHIHQIFAATGINNRVLLAVWWDRQTRKAA